GRDAFQAQAPRQLSGTRPAFAPGMTRVAAPLHHSPESRLQWIEVSTFFRIPRFVIVGLPSREIDESRERIHAAFESSGLEFPRRKVVVNLSPAEIPKRGTGLD